MKLHMVMMLCAATLAPLAVHAESPEIQQQFNEIVAITQAAAGKASNDMQKGGIRAKREKLLCALLPDLAVRDWSAKVYEVSANSDGKGVLTLEAGERLWIKTWNNAFSDMFDNTLLEPDTEVFNQASALASGQMVRFSGSFIKEDSGGCLRESSLTLDGKLTEPEFLFRFTNIAPQ